jgi:hypothetical protein
MDHPRRKDSERYLRNMPLELKSTALGLEDVTTAGEQDQLPVYLHV